MIHVVILGLGFMGKVHARCYRANPDARVVGVVDADHERAQATLTELGLNHVVVAGSLAEVLAQTTADVADICLPTDAHPTAAAAAFAEGLDVFCEKPIALDVASAEAMTRQAAAAGRQLMVGHCLRFWPEYRALKAMLNDAEAGRLLALTLFRRSSRPAYTAGNWTADPTRCLGAALDLHIHDTDVVHYLLGAPERVFSRGVRLPTGWDHLQTHYVFPDCAVQAEGGWSFPEGWGFQMGFSALFENGSLDFDSLVGGGLRKNIGGKAVPVDLTPETDTPAEGNLAGLEAYQRQLDYFIACLTRGEPVRINTGEQATASLRTLQAEIESATTGQPVSLPRASDEILST